MTHEVHILTSLVSIVGKITIFLFRIFWNLYFLNYPLGGSLIQDGVFSHFALQMAPKITRPNYVQPFPLGICQKQFFFITSVVPDHGWTAGNFSRSSMCDFARCDSKNSKNLNGVDYSLICLTTSGGTNWVSRISTHILHETLLISAHIDTKLVWLWALYVIL